MIDILIFGGIGLICLSVIFLLVAAFAFGKEFSNVTDQTGKKIGWYLLITDSIGMLSLFIGVMLKLYYG